MSTAVPPVAPATPSLDPGLATGSGFKDAVARHLDKLNQLQATADHLASRFAAGQDVEAHQVMIAAEEASLATHLALQVRNRALEAFQEIMRMQV